MNSKFPQCASCTNSVCLINKHCSREWKVRLSANRGVSKYKSGQGIFYENNMVSGFYFIYEGKVKEFTIGKKNKQQIIRLASSGEIIGLRPYDETNYRMSCIALSDATLCLIEKELFFDALRENVDLAMGLINFYAHQAADMEIRQIHLSQLSAAERIADALLLIKEKFGKKIEKGFYLDVNFSRQDIADLAGIAKEEAIRVLSVFNKQKLIELQKKNTIVIYNYRKLMKMVLEDCCEKDSYYHNTGKCISYLMS